METLHKTQTDLLWYPDHGITDFVIDEFSCGGCYELALAIHETTGWPVVGEFVPQSDGSEVLYHAWVMSPNGRAVDISGVHSGGRAVTVYDQITGGHALTVTQPRPIRGDEIRIDDEMLSWARELVQNFPDYFVIMH